MIISVMEKLSSKNQFSFTTINSHATEYFFRDDKKITNFVFNPITSSNYETTLHTTTKL